MFSKNHRLVGIKIAFILGRKYIYVFIKLIISNKYDLCMIAIFYFA